MRRRLLACSALTRLAAAVLASTALFASGAIGEVTASALQIRWLGVAGFSISSDGTTLVQDPFFTRPGMLRTLFRRYVPNEDAIDFAFAAAPELGSASEILVGHSHYDHSGDVAAVALRSAATVRGSHTTDRLVRAYGLPAERSQIADPGDRFDAGPFQVEVIESRHAEVLMGRVPLPGTLDAEVEAPLHAFSFPLGDARAYLLTHRPSGVRLLLTSSAAIHLPAIEAIEAPVDVLLLATQGRAPEYIATLVEELRPRLVIPHHYESFFVAIDDPDAAQPSDAEDLERFGEEVRAAAAAAGIEVEVRRLGLFESLALP